ncbi:MAG: MFS transporter [Pseudonocardia sp.]|nr:MFS transporter [Pseudonocardia sp.]MBO0872435.1 MFS transporter [Pseudonocardia sp.]
MRRGDQIVQELPWRWTVQGKIFVIGGIGYAFDAWDVALTGVMLPLLTKDFGLSGGQQGLFAAAGLAGMAVGAFCWGTVADVLGRKRAFSLTLLVFGLVTLLGAASPNFWFLLATRFLAGIGLGGCVPVDYAMVAEFCPHKMRGRVLTGMDLWWPIGATACALTAIVLEPLHSWRAMLLVMVLPALLTFWVRRSVPESPLFLASQGRNDEARAVIQDMVDRTGATVPPWDVTRPPPSHRETPGVLITKFRDVWAYNWRATSASWGIAVTVLVLYFGALVWLPTILSRQGLGDTAAFAVSSGFTAIGILGVLVSAWLVDQVGRKWTIIASAVVASVSMVAFAAMLGSSGARLFWILLFGLVIEVTIPAVYCYIPELYPTRLRGSGFGWANTASRLASALVPVLFGALLWPVLGLTWTFVVVGLVVVASMVWLGFVGPETRGVELDEDEHAAATPAGPARPGGAGAAPHQ